MSSSSQKLPSGYGLYPPQAPTTSKKEEKTSKINGKKVAVAAIVGTLVALTAGLIISAHYGCLGHTAKEFINQKIPAFFSQKIPGFFNHKFVPFVKSHIAPALKSAALKVNHFMTSSLPGTHGKLPVWVLLEGANLGLLGLTAGIGFYQAKKMKDEQLQEEINNSF